MQTLTEIEIQLKQRISNYPPTPWGKKQTDNWDRQTNFIYKTFEWEHLTHKIATLETPLANYAINRWFSFWSAMAVEQIFCALPNVKIHTNKYDRLVDFTLHGINFDHKTSVFPQRYPYSFDFAYAHTRHLIRWLYEHQSRQQRHHTANRLFILLYDAQGEHWKLRAEISGLQQLIETYVAQFEPDKQRNLSIGSETVVSDILWLSKQSEKG
ncbi:MAG: hypothetical protein AAF485_25210 [Chloroflexota bacterium]